MDKQEYELLVKSLTRDVGEEMADIEQQLHRRWRRHAIALLILSLAIGWSVAMNIIMLITLRS